MRGAWWASLISPKVMFTVQVNDLHWGWRYFVLCISDMSDDPCRSTSGLNIIWRGRWFPDENKLLQGLPLTTLFDIYDVQNGMSEKHVQEYVVWSYYVYIWKNYINIKHYKQHIHTNNSYQNDTHLKALRFSTLGDNIDYDEVKRTFH